MKKTSDPNPEILAEIPAEKPVTTPLPELTPRQRYFMQQAAEEDICLDFLPPDADDLKA